MWQIVAGTQGDNAAPIAPMLLRNTRKTGQAWQSTDPLSIDLFTLEEAIEFDEAFFMPLLEG